LRRPKKELISSKLCCASAAFHAKAAQTEKPPAAYREGQNGRQKEEKNRPEKAESFAS
jgi:hypothetical protein